MHILVVNNESIHTQELINASRQNGRHTVSKASWHELPSIYISKYEAIILSGSSHYSVRVSRKVYEAQKEMLMNAQIPIIGICAGFELICDVFGSPLHRSVRQISGVFRLTRLTDNDGVFDAWREYEVFEKHKIFVTSVESPLIPLAYTNDNVAVIKHESKSIYGLQFHPEVRSYGNNGLLILHRILSLIAGKANTP